MGQPMKCPECGWTKMVSELGETVNCANCGKAVVYVPVEQPREQKEGKK